MPRGATAALSLCCALALGARAARAQGSSSTSYPIDLATALRLADAQNLDVQIARERVNEAKANRTRAMEQFFPWLAPGVGYHRRDGVAQASPSGIIGKADYQAYSPGLSVVAQVTPGDAIYNSLAARQLVRASGEGLETQRQGAALRAAAGYLDLAKAKALVEVVRSAMLTSQDYQQQLHEAVTVGIAFRGDELRVQSQTEHYQLVLRQAVAQQRVAAVELATVLHLDAGVELVPRDDDLVPLALVDTAWSADSLVARAMRSRPELRQTAALLAASRASRDAALYGPLIPSIGAQFFAGSLGGGPDSGRGKVAGMTDLAVGVNWRIGPGGLFDFGRINATASQLATAQLGELKLRDAVAAEVVAGLTRVRALAEQIALAARALATASETLRLTRARKEFGVGLVLEDIQAQQAVTQARSDYVTAIAEFDKAQYALSRAVGGASAGSARPPER
jgi:outer membrane protein TolC